MEIVIDVCVDALLDSFKILPFLFIVYLFIEYAEHKGSEKLANSLTKLGPFGAVGGAILGCVPQCGFSVMAANLFAGRLISAGTLIAVFISTSDEAVPIIISQPDRIGVLWRLIAAKVLIAVVAGILVDLVLKILVKGKMEEKPFEELCAHCGCEHHSVLHSAIKHTVSIALFILVVNIILNSAIELVGDDRISKILMTDSAFQPFVAALIGFIPNCASSVILTQLFLDGVLSFGSVVAGLSTGAGVGLVVLFKTNRHLKQNLAIVAVLYAVAVISGTVINLL